MKKILVIMLSLGLILVSSPVMADGGTSTGDILNGDFSDETPV